MRSTLALGLCLLGLAAGQHLTPRELGRFTVNHAGFVEVFEEESGRKVVYITTFNPATMFFHDPVYFLAHPGELLDSVSTWDEHIYKLGGESSAFWPNYPVYMPVDVAGFEGIVQTSGFLVPGKSAGKLEVYDTANFNTPHGPYDIASDEDHDWSYHWIIWKDVDNDGLLDALTARFRVPLLGDPISQLLWFKNPGTERPAEIGNWPWQSNLLLEGGPDVYFEERVLEKDGVEYNVLVTGELWTERIMLYYVENVPGAWADPANIKSVVVDEAPGQPFEVHLFDFNMDGNLEIICSAFDTRKGNETGNLWIYEMSGDWSQSEGWTRRNIASGFKANNYLFGNSMTPGKQRPFWPSEEYKNTPTENGGTPKPYIALSGDDDGVHYILYPKSEDPTNWEYEMQVLVDTEETTAGTMAVSDLDGDGYVEIISAGFTAGTVYVHTFAP